ncbi:MAG: hypothetical protein LBT05_10555 [Planctomycetaceae bacterium]|jgi:transcription elongation factor Elf1|nr:hypothetical protein [Planctomycetaceae bacterium]
MSKELKNEELNANVQLTKIPDVPDKKKLAKKEKPTKLKSEKKFVCPECGSKSGKETYRTENVYNEQRIVRHWIQCEKCRAVTVTRDVWDID